MRLNFDATQVEPNTAFEPLPTGSYPISITKSEEKPTKANNGSYLEFEMTILGGEFKGRKVFDRLNLKNPSEVAVNIAYKTLSAICRCVGVFKPQESSQLHGKPFIAIVEKVERNDQPGTWTNNIRGYKTIDGLDPGSVGTVAQPAAQPSWANTTPNGIEQQGANPEPQQPQQAAQPTAAQAAPTTGARPPWAA